MHLLLSVPVVSLTPSFIIWCLLPLDASRVSNEFGRYLRRTCVRHRNWIRSLTVPSVSLFVLLEGIPKNTVVCHCTSEVETV